MKRRMSIIVLVALLIYLIPAQAFAARKVLSVPEETAQVNCGASCASMVTRYFKGDTTNREQLAWDNRTSYNKNCSTHSTSASWWNCTGYFSVRALSGEQGGSYSHSNNLSYTTYKNGINAGSPMTIGLNNYIGSVHAIAWKGYDTGTSGTEQWVIYNDPYDGSGHSATLGWLESNWDIRGYSYWK